MTDVTESWLPSLDVPTPEADLALAVKLARMGVKLPQPSEAVRQELRPTFEKDAGCRLRPRT